MRVFHSYNTITHTDQKVKKVLQLFLRELLFAHGEKNGFAIAASAHSLLPFCVPLRRAGVRFRPVDIAAAFIGCAMDYYGVSRHALPYFDWGEPFDAAAVNILIGKVSTILRNLL